MINHSPIRWNSVKGQKGRRQLDSDLHFYLNDNHLLTVPRGYISDGMSFPWFIRLTWDDPWHDRYEAVAWLHDYLCDWLKEGNCPYKKRFVDWLFEGCLLSNNVSSLEAWIFKNAVRTRR